MTNTTLPSPSSQNESWGFFGAMNEHAAAAWPIACAAVARATQLDADAARAFLDSRHGRHFADDVRNCLDAGAGIAAAIDAATARWMAWTIGRETSRWNGIPRGLPYLTGFAASASIGA